MAHAFSQSLQRTPGSKFESLTRGCLAGWGGPPSRSSSGHLQLLKAALLLYTTDGFSQHPNTHIGLCRVRFDRRGKRHRRYKNEEWHKQWQQPTCTNRAPLLTHAERVEGDDALGGSRAPVHCPPS